MKEPQEKRLCPHCGNEIGNKHRTRKYCEKTIAPDGSINSCKDDFHNAKKQLRYHKIKSISKAQLENFEVLDHFAGQGKFKISSAELEKAGLKMHFYIVRMKIPGTHEYGLYYIDYLLRGNNPNELTIEKHEYKF